MSQLVLDDDGRLLLSADGRLFLAVSSTPSEPVPVDLVVSVLASSDDAVETTATGAMALTTTVVTCNTTNQPAFRFVGITIPQAAEITAATIQFTASAAQSTAVSVRIYGQAADNAATFTTTAFNITGRPKTTAFVDWAIPAFTASARTAAQQTPDLTTIIQEIVDRGSWTSGNAIAFMLAYLSGGGQRSLVAEDDGTLTEATLTVTYLQDAPTDLGYLVTDYLLSGYFTS